MKRKKASDGDPDKKRGAIKVLGELVAPVRRHRSTHIERHGLAARL